MNRYARLLGVVTALVLAGGVAQAAPEGGSGTNAEARPDLDARNPRGRLSDAQRRDADWHLRELEKRGIAPYGSSQGQEVKNGNGYVSGSRYSEAADRGRGRNSRQSCAGCN